MADKKPPEIDDDDLLREGEDQSMFDDATETTYYLDLKLGSQRVLLYKMTPDGATFIWNIPGKKWIEADIWEDISGANGSSTVQEITKEEALRGTGGVE